MNINVKNTNIYPANFKQSKIGFFPKKKHENDAKQTENKQSSFKKFSDTLIVSSSALIVGLSLLASSKKGKNDVLLRKVQDLEQKAKYLEQELQDDFSIGQKAPFVKKFGCFWDKLSKNHKELTNKLIYGIGVIAIEPLVILFSPFGHDKSSEKDKVSAIARLPITFLSTFSFQYSIDKFLSNLIPQLSKEGLLGKDFQSFSNTFDDLPLANKTKIKSAKEMTVFALGLLTIPLGVALTNTFYGKFLKWINSIDKKDKNQNSQPEITQAKNNVLSCSTKRISFRGSRPAYLAKEMAKNAGEIKENLVKDFKPSKGMTKKFYEFVSKPIKSVLESTWLDKKTSKLGKEGIDSTSFQKLLMWGIVMKDTMRALTNAYLYYNNEDIPPEQRLYLLFFHIGVAVPNILLDIVAGFGAIKYQDKILENMLKKFKLSELVHQKTKNGLKFFIPVAMTTIIGKRIITPALATPIAGILKKKSLDKKNEEDKQAA